MTVIPSCLRTKGHDLKASRHQAVCLLCCSLPVLPVTELWYLMPYHEQTTGWGAQKGQAKCVSELETICTELCYKGPSVYSDLTWRYQVKSRLTNWLREVELNCTATKGACSAAQVEFFLLWLMPRVFSTIVKSGYEEFNEKLTAKCKLITNLQENFVYPLTAITNFSKKHSKKNFFLKNFSRQGHSHHWSYRLTSKSIVLVTFLWFQSTVTVFSWASRF